MTIFNITNDCHQKISNFLTYQEVTHLKRTSKTLNLICLNLKSETVENQEAADLIAKLINRKVRDFSRIQLNHFFKKITAKNLTELFKNYIRPKKLISWVFTEEQKLQDVKILSLLMPKQLATWFTFSDCFHPTDYYLSLQKIIGLDLTLFDQFSKLQKENFLKLMIANDDLELFKSCILSTEEYEEALSIASKYIIDYQRTDFLYFIIKLLQFDSRNWAIQNYRVFTTSQISILISTLEMLCYLKEKDLLLNELYKDIVSMFSRTDLNLPLQQLIQLAFSSASKEGFELFKKIVECKDFKLFVENEFSLVSSFISKKCFEHIHFGWLHNKLNFKFWKDKFLKAGISQNQLPN